MHDNEAPFRYDEDITLTVSDWYHDLVEDIRFMSLYNPTGAEPVPNAFLVNDTQNFSVPVQPNTSYLLRVINIGAFVGQYFYIEDHNFTIVEVDGVYTEPQDANMIYIAVAQRYAILLTTKNTTDRNFGIVTIADNVLLDTIPSSLQLNQTNWLEYNASAPHTTTIPDVDISSVNPAFDDFRLVPYDNQSLFENPAQTISLTVSMDILQNGIPYAFLNDRTFVMPKVPSLLTAVSADNNTVADAACHLRELYQHFCSESHGCNRGHHQQ